jgi:hypothetical protein
MFWERDHEWYLRRAAHRALLEIQEYQRTSAPAVPAADPVEEAMKAAAELRERGQLN